MVEPFKNGVMELSSIAAKHQGDRIYDFPKSAACIHEAGHCVVAAREGINVEHAKVWRTHSFGREGWLGQYIEDGSGRMVEIKIEDINAIVPRMAVTLAGRVSERLFCPDFNLIAGLEEMIYANFMLMWCSAIRSGGKDFMEFHRLWSYVLQRVEATLRTHEGAVRAIADVLMRDEVIRDPQLQTLLTGVSKWQGEVVIDPDAALLRDPLEELH